MQKRGQITVFVILGIIVFSIVALGIVFRTQLVESFKVKNVAELTQLSETAKESGFTIQNCLGSVAEVAVMKLGERGFLAKDSKRFDYNGNAVYMLFDQESIFAPDREIIESELSKAIKEEGQKCAKISSKAEIVASKIKNVKVNIEDDKIRLIINWPIKFKSNGVTEKLEQFNVNVPVRAGKVLNIVDRFLDEQRNNPDMVCLDCLIKPADQYGMQIIATPYSDKYIFLIEDKDYNDFMYLFGGALS